MDTKLIGTKMVADGTEMFLFEKPAGFEFKAGQSIDLSLVNPPETDAEGDKRAFSIVAAPHEAHLAIATRMRDTAFKRVLKFLPAGAPLTLEGPFGDLVLHENAARPAVILAGGIGITPFRSMAADAAHRALPHRITLIYSNRAPKDAPFLEELQALALENPNFTFVPTMTDPETPAEWKGARGLINADLVKQYIEEGSQPIYYLAGPAGMVKAMRELLNGMGVSNDDIRTEEFTGY